MAVARPTTTPNPDAMKFTLDITLPERILANHGDDVDDEFTSALLATEGVASVFGVNDFVTITRVNGAAWDPIVCAVEEAATAHLPACVDDPEQEAAVARARALLRNAARRPASTAVEIHPSSGRDLDR
jgi:Scaffold protein Nfu/NifU N terminal